MRTNETLLTIATVLAGCAGLDEARVEQAAGGGDCENILCGNSSEVPYMGFHDASLRGEANVQGISIEAIGGRAQIRQGPATYDLGIKNHRLQGMIDSNPVLEGQALVGADLVMLQDGAPAFAIHIESVREDIPFPFQPGTFDAYRFSRHKVGEAPSPDQHLCNGPMLYPPKKDKWEVFLGLEVDETLVFQGDRIDAEAMTMSFAPDPDWFNFACAGHALAKLHLTGHTCAAQGPACADKDRWRARQATLKLLVADYCGKGKTFTVPGTPLVWMGGPIQYAQHPVDVEARWSEDGATCLGRPRLEAYPDLAAYPDGVLAAIHAQCAPEDLPPPCVNPDVHDLDGAVRISANRPQSPP